VWPDPQLPPTQRRSFVPLAIVGSYSTAIPHFVQHVALLADAVEIWPGEAVPVWHMGPPLHAGTVARAPCCPADLVATVPLNAAQRNALLHWKAQVDKERRPSRLFQSYVVHPPRDWVRSEQGIKLYRRFSCVGFVLEGYAAVGIEILDPQATWPEVHENEVRAAYPQLAQLELRLPEVQARVGFAGWEALGLLGSGPWRIALPGYVFHALHRATNVPRSVADAYFPEQA